MSFDDLFEGRIGSADAFIRRKRAAAEQYRELYYVYENGPVERDELGDIRRLLDTNLLARIPKMDGTEIIRITQLGTDEIECDLEKIQG